MVHVPISGGSFTVTSVSSDAKIEARSVVEPAHAASAPSASTEATRLHPLWRRADVLLLNIMSGCSSSVGKYVGDV